MRRLPGVVLFLAGPVIWYSYFWLVYLIAEAGCTPGGLSLDASGVTLITVGVTVLAGAATTILGVNAARALGDGTDGNWRLMHWGGAVLGGLFTLAIILVGLPALVFAPC